MNKTIVVGGVNLRHLRKQRLALDRTIELLDGPDKELLSGLQNMLDFMADYAADELGDDSALINNY